MRKKLQVVTGKTKIFPALNSKFHFSSYFIFSWVHTETVFEVKSVNCKDETFFIRIIYFSSLILPTFLALIWPESDYFALSIFCTQNQCKPVTGLISVNLPICIRLSLLPVTAPWYSVVYLAYGTFNNTEGTLDGLGMGKFGKIRFEIWTCLGEKREVPTITEKI